MLFVRINLVKVHLYNDTVKGSFHVDRELTICVIDGAISMGCCQALCLDTWLMGFQLVEFNTSVYLKLRSCLLCSCFFYTSCTCSPR